MTRWISSFIMAAAALTALVKAGSQPTCKQGQNCPAEAPCCSRTLPFLPKQTPLKNRLTIVLEYGECGMSQKAHAKGVLETRPNGV